MVCTLTFPRGTTQPGCRPQFSSQWIQGKLSPTIGLLSSEEDSVLQTINAPGSKILRRAEARKTHELEIRWTSHNIAFAVVDVVVRQTSIDDLAGRGINIKVRNTCSRQWGSQRGQG